MTQHELWMRRALQLAKCAEVAGEVPVGAVITLGDDCIAEAWNQPITSHDPSAHAEIVALRIAGQKQQNYRLLEATMYVTLEPCLMCTGALMQARVKRVVYGARETNLTAGMLSLLDSQLFNHSIEIVSGIMETECSRLLTGFFQQRR